MTPIETLTKVLITSKAAGLGKQNFLQNLCKHFHCFILHEPLLSGTPLCGCFCKFQVYNQKLIRKIKKPRLCICVRWCLFLKWKLERKKCYIQKELKRCGSSQNRSGKKYIWIINIGNIGDWQCCRLENQWPFRVFQIYENFAKQNHHCYFINIHCGI